MSRPPAGFTLVELLVVVAIVVALLALLAPAMDRAVYQAELAVCGATQSQAAKGFLAYTQGSRRLFPYRPTQDSTLLASRNGLRRRPHVIKDAVGAGGRTEPLALGATGEGAVAKWADDRPYLREAGSLDLLLDPLCPKIDLDRAQPNAIASGNYALWFGFSYPASKGGGRGLLRLGDELEWTDNWRDLNAAKQGFRVLVSDWDMPMPIFEANAGAHQKVITSHPDEQQVLYAQYGENGSWSYSWWTSGLAAGTSKRPPIDLSFAMTDGSVQRVKQVAWDDDRMARMPYDAWANNWSPGNEAASGWNHLPRQ